MPTEFVGQNGALIKTTTKITAIGCPKAKKVTHKKKAHKQGRKAGGTGGKGGTAKGKRGGRRQG